MYRVVGVYPMQIISFDCVNPDASVEVYVWRRVQYLNLVDVLMCFLKLEHVGLAHNWRAVLEKDERLRGELVEFGITDRGAFDGISFPGMLKLLRMLKKRTGLTDEQHDAVGKKLREVFRGHPKVLDIDAPPGAAPAVPSSIVVLKEGLETVVKIMQGERGTGADSDDSGDGWLDVRVVVKGGREYLSTRDIIKHMIEKAGKPVVQAWQKLKESGKIDLGALMTHKFKGSGEVDQDVIERACAGALLAGLSGEAAERNRRKMQIAILGEQADDVNPAPQAGNAGSIRKAGAKTREELFQMLDALDPEWRDALWKEQEAKRAKLG